MTYDKKLLRLAKILDRLSPDECITTITAGKTVKGLKLNPELRISYFDPECPSDISALIVREPVKIIDGVEVSINYFGNPEQESVANV